MKSGRVLSTRYERRALLAAGVAESLVDDPDYVPVRCHLEHADRFEHALFRISPRDAELMDPQHRLMLEAAWAALEDAGTGMLGSEPTTAVFASGSGSGYLRSMLDAGPLDPITLDQALHGTEPDFIAGLIAYKLDLTGPALAVQTACSSSLVAVHLAVQALLNGDCDRALVVAAGIDFPQGGHLHVSGGIQSRSGRCLPFDESADGVVSGSGVACVVLRRLADALGESADVYGVILGSAINNDGAAKAGYYAPSGAGQEAVIRAALGAADVDAASVGYLEAHATGTRVGDPIEWAAACAAYGSMGAAPGQLAVGALKANVGHLDAAAGLAALIKTLLVLKEGVVPPVAGFTRLNPLLDPQDAPLFVPTRLQAWDGPEPRRAGVSAFGIGGTNAHVIVEQPPASPVAPTRAARGPRLVALSALDSAALSRSTARLREQLERRPPELADVAFTLATGRAPLAERCTVVGGTGAEVAERLATGVGVVRGRAPSRGSAPVIFMFPGQGSQHPGMARPLCAGLPGFVSALEATLALFEPALSAELRRALLDSTFPDDALEETALAQPALFALEHAAAVALSALGVRPAGVVGHSLGEVTAACIAGGLDPADAARFVTTRARAMQRCSGGAMLALGCDETRTRELIARSGLALDLAAVNAPESCVVAGSVDQIETFQTFLGMDLFWRRLRVGRAFHSARIEPALPELARQLEGLKLHRLVLPLAANLSGAVLPARSAVTADLFVEQARHTVRFADAIAAIAGIHPEAILVEVGPGRTLSTFAASAERTTVSLAPARADDEGQEVLRALGTLWTCGQPVDLARLCAGGRPVHLPSYPFAGPSWLAAEIRRSRTGAAARLGADDPSERRPAPAAAIRVSEDVGDLAALLPTLWVEVLGREPHEESDFFDLGGDSLLIVNLARRIKQKLGLQVPLRAMLSARTLGRQRKLIADLLAESGASLES